MEREIKAAGNFIIIEKSNKPEVMPSGLEFSEQDLNDQRAQRATVVSAGSLVTGVESGDDIYYDKARAFDQIVMGIERVIIKETDVIVIIPHDEQPAL